MTYIHEMYCATKRLPFPVDVVSLVCGAIGVCPAAGTAALVSESDSPRLKRLPLPVDVVSLGGVAIGVVPVAGTAALVSDSDP